MVCKLRSSDAAVNSSFPSNLCADLSSIKHFVAIEGHTVLGYFDSVSDAAKCIEEQKEKDFFWLILHKTIIKKILKNKFKVPEKVYYIAEVMDT